MMSDKELYYYNLFLNNFMRGALYCIELIDGTILKGYPEGRKYDKYYVFYATQQLNQRDTFECH